MVKSTATPDLHDRFKQLAKVLQQQPWPEGIREKFEAKMDGLIAEYEAENPGAIPPLLRFREDYSYEMAWPAGWRK